MVAKITFPKKIEAALNYNEKKVQSGMAHCLYAGNFLLAADKMNFYQKLATFERLNSLNERATTDTLHVSLNFDPKEKMDTSKLIDIASTYMQKIGFGDQPFLIYKHMDAGHPHIHIVSNTIRQDGKRIDTHNIGRNQSEKARKEIETDFGLIKAEKQEKFSMPAIVTLEADKVVYGKSETKRGIANSVGYVFGKYLFSSLPEYNAALKQFNIAADKGKQGGRINKHHGLVYRILDSEGNKVGVPIKASDIFCKPTLGNLDKKFQTNTSQKEPFKIRLKNTLDKLLMQHLDLPGLMAALKHENIFTLLRGNGKGQFYGITFVDNRSKCVFNGSEIGKNYSVAGLVSMMSKKEAVSGQEPEKAIAKEKDKNTHSTGSSSGIDKPSNVTAKAESKSNDLLDILLSPMEQANHVSNPLLKKKKKKKRRNQDL